MECWIFWLLNRKARITNPRQPGAPGDFSNQFFKDLSNAKDLSQIKWIFDGGKYPPEFKKRMIDAINKLDNLNDDLARKFIGIEDVPSFKQYLIDNFDEVFKLIPAK